MASAARPRIRSTHRLKAVVKSQPVKISPSGDSVELLLHDVVREIGVGLEKMSPSERTKAIMGIHAIAENVRKRQA